MPAVTRKGALVVVEHVTTHTTLFSGIGSRVSYRLHRVASASREGIARTLENPGGKPVRITRHDTVFTLPPLAPAADALEGTRWDSLEECKAALLPFREEPETTETHTCDTCRSKGPHHCRTFRKLEEQEEEGSAE